MLAQAAVVPAAKAQNTPGPTSNDQTAADREILVLADRLGSFPANVVEDEIGELDIAAYGEDNVGVLLEDIAGDLGSGEEGPVVLINGQLATSVNEINDLPTEALQKIQLLPRDASAQLGQTSGRRVVNVVIKCALDQKTILGEAAAATAGGGRSGALSGTLTRLRNRNRTNITLRTRYVEPMRESERGIRSRVSGTPYDLAGTIVPSPISAAEIDPLLSSAVGYPVTIAFVPPGIEHPSLIQIAQGAGRAGTGGIGRYRRLIGEMRSAYLNAALTRYLGEGTSLTGTLRADSSKGERLGGAPSVVLTLPPTSPYSPFMREVGIARYLPVALRQDNRSRSVEANVQVNRSAGQWSLSLGGSYSYREDRYAYQRRTDTAALQAGVSAGTINPFGLLPANLLAITQIDRTVASQQTSTIDANASGPLLKLPTGVLQLSVRAGAKFDNLNGYSRSSGGRTDDRYRRSETNGQVSLQMPLLSNFPDRPSPLGALSLNLSDSFSSGCSVG